jgi:hypothetical protein
MIMKEEKATWIPATGEFLNHGWLDFGKGDIWIVTDIHSYDDYGVSLDTFRLEKDGEKKEIYSYDEGFTFTFDCY